MATSEDITAETKVIPRPVASVMENLEEISRIYSLMRLGTDSYDALEMAVASALPEPQANDVLWFIRGEHTSFPAETGAQFAETLGTHLETLYEHQSGIDAILKSAPEGRTTPQPTKDVVDVAEWIAGNKETSHVYRHAQDKYPDLAARILATAVEDIVAAASGAWTKTGRKVKIEQAEGVVTLLGRKAKGHADPLALNQVVWCEALANALRPLRK